MNQSVRNPKPVTNDVVTRGALPGSRKVHVGAVPFREVALSGGEAPVRLYDTSGPYTDEKRAASTSRSTWRRSVATGFWRGATSRNIRAARAGTRTTG